MPNESNQPVEGDARLWSPAAAGIGMALGIFGLAALPRLPFAAGWLTSPLALALLILWVTLGAAYARALVMGGAKVAYVRPVVGRFAIGTWVADSAVTAQLVLRAAPEWRPVALVIAAVGLLVWLWYVPLAADGFRRLLSAPGRHAPTGLILLSTVSIQALVIAALELFPEQQRPLGVALIPIVAGYLVYALGAAIIVRRYCKPRGWRLDTDWDNSNCILHGAMSISGLAAVTSGVMPVFACRLTWIYVVVVFILVESIELARLAVRVRHCGWRRGAFSHNVSQWARVFTFGMFYAFTLALVQIAAARFQSAWPLAIETAIVQYGPYLVAAFVLLELILLLASLRERPT